MWEGRVRWEGRERSETEGDGVERREMGGGEASEGQLSGWSWSSCKHATSSSYGQAAGRAWL